MYVSMERKETKEEEKWKRLWKKCKLTQVWNDQSEYFYKLTNRVSYHAINLFVCVCVETRKVNK